MLTTMCPNCRHRFPVPGCCNPDPPMGERISTSPRDCNSGYYGGLLLPRGYNSNGGRCFINTPTIIHGPMFIQSNCESDTCNRNETSSQVPSNDDDDDDDDNKFWRDQANALHKRNFEINTSCDSTGSTVTITTPSAQCGGGCLIQNTDSHVIVQAPMIVVRQKLSAGGGCIVQKKLSSDDCTSNDGIIIGIDNSPIRGTLSNISYSDGNSSLGINKMEEILINSPPSGCQELPGTRRSPSPSIFLHQQTVKCNSSKSWYCGSLGEKPDSRVHTPARMSENCGVQIQVNAMLQLPSNTGGHCTVNITATTNTTNTENKANSIGTPTSVRVVRNNFNGGGLVNVDDNNSMISCEENDRGEEDAPTTPLSWLTPCPWAFDNYLAEKDLIKLQEVKRLLHMSGWYHEGLSWQQSENILKNLPVGKWLLRDSSDSRYAFAVSVQTTRGPTSVRILYSDGKFRLDAEPTLVHTMPTFDCPIKMLEYYVEYSKKIQENQRHVWVDYSGLLFSHIYLTQPLVKEARSLSHLARLALDKTKFHFDNLPAPIKNYINEYPYSF